MTDSKKLDLLLEKVTGIEADVVELKSDVAELKSDVVELKSNVAELKSDMVEVKADIEKMKGKIIHLEHYGDIILDEVERVHGILDAHKADKKAHTA